jgi:hypothetical protein
MSYGHQNQRQAIVELVGLVGRPRGVNPQRVPDYTKIKSWRLDGQEVYLLGISREHYGDLPNGNVAVFGKEPRVDGIPNTDGQREFWHAVLMEDISEEEQDKERERNPSCGNPFNVRIALLQYQSDAIDGEGQGVLEYTEFGTAYVRLSTDLRG